MVRYNPRMILVPRRATPSFIAAALALAGCRSIITDKIEAVPEKRLDTSIVRPIQSVQVERVSLQEQQILVEIFNQRRCILAHRDQVKVTTSYKLEPINVPVLLLATGGAVLGGSIVQHWSNGCRNFICEAFAPAMIIGGSSLAFTSAGVMVNQLWPSDPVPHVASSVVTSEERGACGQEPQVGLSHELVFPSGFRLKGATDAAGQSTFPLSDEIVSELRKAGGKVVLWSDGLPLRPLDLSASLSRLPAPTPPSPSASPVPVPVPLLREPRRNQISEPPAQPW